MNLLPDPLEPGKLQEIEASMETVKKDPELRKLTVGGGKNFRNIYEQKIELVAKAIRAVL